MLYQISICISLYLETRIERYLVTGTPWKVPSQPGGQQLDLANRQQQELALFLHSSPTFCSLVLEGK